MQKTAFLEIDKEKNSLSIKLFNGHKYTVGLKQHNIETNAARQELIETLSKGIDKAIQRYFDMAGLRYEVDAGKG
jgi:hypothetical protein